MNEGLAISKNPTNPREVILVQMEEISEETWLDEAGILLHIDPIIWKERSIENFSSMVNSRSPIKILSVQDMIQMIKKG